MIFCYKHLWRAVPTSLMCRANRGESARWGREAGFRKACCLVAPGVNVVLTLQEAVCALQSLSFGLCEACTKSASHPAPALHLRRSVCFLPVTSRRDVRWPLCNIPCAHYLLLALCMIFQVLVQQIYFGIGTVSSLATWSLTSPNWLSSSGPISKWPPGVTTIWADEFTPHSGAYCSPNFVSELTLTVLKSLRYIDGDGIYLLWSVFSVAITSCLFLYFCSIFSAFPSDEQC